MDPRQLTDKELYKRCLEAGQNARKWLKVFAGLLPEVERRELYKKHGFHSIFEFAAKLAGLRRENVVEILRVYNKVEDKPALKKLFESGEQGWAKIKEVASVANKETDGLWAKRVKTLSKQSVRELAKSEREKIVAHHSGALLQEEVEIRVPVRAGAGFERKSITIQLDPDIYAQLIDLKAKLEKKGKEPIDYNEVIKKILSSFNFEKENLIPYQEVIHRCPECRKNTIKSECGDIELNEKDLKNRGKVGESVILEDKKEIKTNKPSRYIPAKVKKIIQLKHGKGCSYPGCKKPAKVLHHTKRFALDPSPDPDFLKPLCKTHHELCHGAAVHGEDGDAGQWKLSLVEVGDIKKRFVDGKGRGFRGGL